MFVVTTPELSSNGTLFSLEKIFPEQLQLELSWPFSCLCLRRRILQAVGFFSSVTDLFSSFQSALQKPTGKQQ